MITQASIREHTEWLGLCQTLKTLGAVTQADLESPQSARDTAGQLLLADIRQWGESRAAIALEQSQKGGAK